MNELGQRALEVFRMHPNLMPGMSDTELVTYCEELGAEMMTAREALRDDLFFRELDARRDQSGRAPSDGNVRAAMFRSATAQATEIVLSERVYALLEDPTVSPELPDGTYDEDLEDLEVTWHPDWVEMLDEPPWLYRMLDDDHDEMYGLIKDDPWTWWRVMPSGVAMYLDGGTINRALADGRLVWLDGEVVPRKRIERLAAEAAGAPKQTAR